MGSYRLTRRAERDLIEIYLYTLETFGVAQVERYAEAMRSCFALLADNPSMGRKADAVRPGLRRHEHGGHVIFYRGDSERDSLLILTVIHARQRPDLAGIDLD